MFVAWLLDFGVFLGCRISGVLAGGFPVGDDLLWLGLYRFVRVAACGLALICFAGWSDLVYPGGWFWFGLLMWGCFMV